MIVDAHGDRTMKSTTIRMMVGIVCFYLSLFCFIIAIKSPPGFAAAFATVGALSGIMSGYSCVRWMEDD
jgi:hypothetical protein